MNSRPLNTFGLLLAVCLSLALSLRAGAQEEAQDATAPDRLLGAVGHRTGRVALSLCR
jgi:hypothetical protein